MPDIIRVAIVGAGRTGGPLLEALLELPYVRVVGVADRNLESPGALLARERGIFCVQYADVLVAKSDEIDLIVDVSGDPTIKPMLRDVFMAQGNRRTVIVTDLVARLILSIATGSPELAETNHPADQGIG